MTIFITPLTINLMAKTNIPDAFLEVADVQLEYNPANLKTKKEVEANLERKLREDYEKGI